MLVDGILVVYLCGCIGLLGYSLAEGWNSKRPWETAVVILLWPVVFGIVHPITHVRYERWRRLYNAEARRRREHEPRTMTDAQQDELWRKMCR